METLTFTSLFERDKEQLRASLQGSSLPKDAQKVQTVVSQYLASMFDSEGELRLSLTQSEDYILQAALSLLNAQQQMASTLIKESVKANLNSNSHAQPAEPTSPKNGNHESLKQNVTSPNASVYAMSGSAIGSVGGAIIFGSWGAVFGAIAGTALALYMSSTNKENTAHTKDHFASKATLGTKAILQEPATTPIDVDTYLGIIKSTCQSVDSLIDTFRVQIKRVANQYENQEKPTLEKDYNSLLEAIQSLLGYERTHDATEEKYITKLTNRIEELAEMLDAYNIEVVDYDGTNDNLFSKAISQKVTEPKMVLPAFVKDGKVVLEGRVFVKEL